MKIGILVIVLLLIPSVAAESYFYAGSHTLAVKNLDGIEYQYSDRLGTDVETQTLPFGQTLQEGKRFGYTGKEKDNSELHYYGSRYLDNNIGRFTSVDPLPDEPSYQYVSNNPLNLIDPTGMIPEGGSPFEFSGPVTHEERQSFESTTNTVARNSGSYIAGELSGGFYDLSVAWTGNDPVAGEYNLGVWGRIGAGIGSAPILPAFKFLKFFDELPGAARAVDDIPSYRKIDPSEAYDEMGAFKTVLNGDRPVGIIKPDFMTPKDLDSLNDAVARGDVFVAQFQNNFIDEFGEIIQQNTHTIVYRNDKYAIEVASELRTIFSRDFTIIDGSLAGEIPHRRIGELLHYTDESIDGFLGLN